MHGSVTKYGHRAGLAGAGVLARMILASFWMKIPVAYRRRYGGEGLGFGSFTDGYMISGQESPMLLGNLDETSFPSLERSMRFSRHELARAPEVTLRMRCLNHPMHFRYRWDSERWRVYESVNGSYTT